MELLERDDLLGELHGRLRRARAGEGSCILLGGEAGVGKTALLRRFTEAARAEAIVLLGQCDALSTPRPLGPLFDIAAGDVALYQLLNEGSPRDLLFRTVLSRLTASNRPTILAIEDAHWADEATLDLLRYLGRRIETSHGLMVVTYRDDEIGPHHPLRGVLGDLATTAAVHRLEIPGLTAAAVAKLAAGSGLDAGQLYTRTLGNPFFVTEILATVGGIPPTVRDAVLARAARLSPGAWDVLEAAAVLGSPVEPELLDRVAEPALVDLEAAVGSGIVQITDEEGGGYAFRHELAREAMLSAVAPSRRIALNARALHVLEGAPVEAHDPARLAHHAEAAGDRDAVLRHAPEAARRAARLRSHREAVEQYSRALRFAGALPTPEQAELLEAMAYECYLTSQIDQAMTARATALAIWSQLGDARKEGENRCYLATLLWAQARIADAEREAERAVALMERIQAGPELAMAYGTLARLRGATRNDDQAILLGEQAIALAEKVGATETLIDALITVGEAKLTRGAAAAGQEQIELGMRLATEAGHDVLAARAYISLGYGFAESGRLAVATHHFERGIQYCLQRDLDLPRYHMTALLARCHASLGAWDDAMLLASSVLSAREVAPGTRFAALLVAGLVRTRRGDSGAESLLEEALALATVSGSAYYLDPIAAVSAESRVLAGTSPTGASDARMAKPVAAEREHTRYAGQLAYWRWKGGEFVKPPATIAGPFSQQVAGDWEGAAAAWDDLGCPYEAAWARTESYNEQALRAALVTFEELGAKPAASMVRSRLREMGARGIPRGPRPSTRTNPGGLTTREIDVVTLLAAGYGNQEIAARLFLSPRTVENHVAAILAKLGAVTRTEAVAAAEALGFVPQTE